jgi:hypothetical protein
MKFDKSIFKKLANIKQHNKTNEWNEWNELCIDLYSDWTSFERMSNVATYYTSASFIWHFEYRQINENRWYCMPIFIYVYRSVDWDIEVFEKIRDIKNFLKNL